MSRPPEGFTRRRLRVSRRPAVLTAVVFGLVGFILASLVLARGLSAAGAERAQVLGLLRAQAAGDSAQVLSRLPACRREPACVSITRRRVAQLRRPGRVEILAFEPSVRVTPTLHTGTARVAWRAGAALPVVQCVRVRRQGPLSGNAVELLSLSAPIPRTGSCASS